MHTPLCRHAVGEPEEYAARAYERGLKGIIVTCHNPLPDGISQDVRMYPQEFPAYIALVERARQAWQGRIDVRLGLEADYLPGLEPFLREQLASAEFHHVLGSVHCQIREYRAKYDDGDALQLSKDVFRPSGAGSGKRAFRHAFAPRFSEKYESARVECRARSPFHRNDVRSHRRNRHRDGIEHVGRDENDPEMNPGPVILKAMRQRGIPVVIGADAHVPERVADRYEKAMDILESVGYDEVNFFLNRKRHSLPIGVARASLKKSPHE